MSAPSPAESPGRLRSLFPVLLAAIAGALHAASFAPWTLWWAQVLTLSGLLWLWLPELESYRLKYWRQEQHGGQRKDRHEDRHNSGEKPIGSQSAGLLRLLLLPFVFSATWFTAGLCWLYISMHDYGNLPAVLAAAAVVALSAFLALFACIAFLLTALCASNRDTPGLLRSIGIALVFGSAWTLAEWLRGTAFTGFPWLAIGYAHVDSPLAGWAPLLGVYGLSGIAAMLAYLLADMLLALGRRAMPGVGKLAGMLAPALAFVLLIACGSALRSIEWSTPTGEMLKVRLLQGNVPQQMKFVPQEAYRAMQAYSRMVAQPGGIGALDLIVLPETAWTIPWAGTDPALVAQMFPTDRSASAQHVAIGMPLPLDSSGQRPTELTSEMILQRRIANSVLLLRSAQPSDQSMRYDKHHLVPFGEFVPWGFQWFVDLMNIPLGSFARGSLEQKPFVIKSQRVAFNICYEDLFGEQLALAARKHGGDATILINVSNIAWFGRSHALGQHLQIARMRTLELARPMLRSTNTGMTASIDSRGKVRAVLENHTVGVLEDEVQGMTGETPFMKWTHWPSLCASAAILAIAGWRRRQTKK